ncbi:MAG: multidrug effflux MFS transporter [Inquilinaceae bacterium]
MPDKINLKIAFLATAFVALGPITMSMYVPSMPAIADSLGASQSAVQLTLSVYLAAFALAQLGYGPLSDRFGRRPVLILGMVIFVVGSGAAALAGSIETLIAARFVQAVGACAGPAVARALVRDLYVGTAAARVLGIIGMTIAVAPAIGPVIGGYLQTWFDWHAVFVFLTTAGVGFLFLAWFGVAETNRQLDRDALSPSRMIRNYAMLLGCGPYIGYVVPIACSLGGYFAFVATAPFLFISLLGLSPETYGWILLLPTACYFLGALTATRIVGRLGINRTVLTGVCIVAAAGGILLAVTMGDAATVVTLMAPMMLWLFGMALVLPSALAGAMAPFPRIAGAASALVGFLQMGTGAAGTFAAATIGDGTARTAGIAPGALAALGLIVFLLLIWRRRHATVTAVPRRKD